MTYFHLLALQLPYVMPATPLTGECNIGQRAAHLGYGWHARLVVFILEQPSSSLMFDHDGLLDKPFADFYLHQTWMMALGGKTPKRTHLKMMLEPSLFTPPSPLTSHPVLDLLDNLLAAQQDLIP